MFEADDNDNSVNIHESLLYAGYKPRSMVSDLVHDAITRAFELLGESCAGLLINHLSAMYRLPTHIVLTRYDLVSKAISQTFGYGSEVFMHEIRANLLKNLPHMDHTLPTEEIIHRAYKVEALRFVRNLRNGYAILVHSNYGSRQEILGSFFQPVSAGRLEYTASGGLATAIIRYDSDGNITAGGRTYCNPESCEHGYYHHYHFHDSCYSPGGSAVKGRYRRGRAGDGGRNKSFLCAYSTYEASQNFSDVVLEHDHVITDQPFVVYSKMQ